MLADDTGAAGRGAQAIALATRVLGAEQLVFGSDYAPVPDIAPGIAQVLAAPISAAARVDPARQRATPVGQQRYFPG